MPTWSSKASSYEAALQTAFEHPETIFEDLRALGVGSRLAAVVTAGAYRYLWGKPPEIV